MEKRGDEEEEVDKERKGRPKRHRAQADHGPSFSPGMCVRVRSGCSLSRSGPLHTEQTPTPLSSVASAALVRPTTQSPLSHSPLRASARHEQPTILAKANRRGQNATTGSIEHCSPRSRVCTESSQRTSSCCFSSSCAENVIYNPFFPSPSHPPSCLSCVVQEKRVHAARWLKQASFA